MKKTFLLTAFIIALSGNAFSQFIASLEGYPLTTTGWTVGGNASAVDSEILLTPSLETQSGYVYYSTPVDLTVCSQFTVEFDFQIIQSGFSTIADGIAFWYISNPPSGFSLGGGIGLPSYPNGLLMILDSYNNNGLPDDNPLETLLYYNNTPPTIPSYVEGSATGLLCPVVTYQSFITDGSWHHCKMTYNAGNINVYFNYSTTASLTGYQPISITGYFGFSSSTGLYYSNQSVKNITINSAGVLPPPPVTAAVNYCNGATAVPLSATGSPLSWFTTDTATVIALPGAPTPNTSVSGTTTYYVRQGTGTCISPPDSIVVTVGTQPPPPVISGQAVYCTGDASVPFTVTGTGILWYTTATGGTGSATAPVVNTAAAGTTTYYASQTVTGGCESARDSITVTVHSTPAAPVLTAGTHVYCQYMPFVPFAATGTNDLWYTTPTGGTGTSVAPIVNTSVVGANTYYVSQTDSGCESPRLAVPVTVNAKPAAPALTAPVYCENSTAVPLTATGTALLWYGPGTTPPSSTAPTPVTTVATTDSYYVTQTVLGCVSDSALDAVVINPLPPPPVTADTSYCQNFSAPALTAVGSGLQWYTTPTGGTASAAAPVPPTNIPGTTTWYVTQAVLGCESSRTPLNVTTIYQPAFTITPSSFNLCQYDSINLAYTGAALVGPAYSWVLPMGAHTVDNTDTFSTPSIVVQFDSANVTSYVYLTTSDGNGKCFATASVKINVEGQPVGIPYTKPDVCVGDTVVMALSYESADAANFIWTIDGMPLANTNALNIIVSDVNSGGPYKISWNDTGSHVIELNSYTTEGCASRPVFDSIEVHAIPDATFKIATKSGAFCLEDSILFTANSTAYNDAFTWSPERFFNNVNKASTWGKVDDNSNVTLVVTDEFGCSATSSQVLNPASCCTVGFPNAFTPNGDTHNDFFKPIIAGNHTFHEFRIANRWGQTIFESNTNDVEWDGTYNGVPQDMGVYYYYIRFDCGGNTVEQKGDLTLIR